MKLVINIPEDELTEEEIEDCIKTAKNIFSDVKIIKEHGRLIDADIIPLTPDVLADALMEERIRGKLNTDTIFENDVIEDVKCRLTVSIIDRRPCYCGAELREVWRESEREGEQE